MQYDTQYAAKMAQELAVYAKRVQSESPDAYISPEVLAAIASVPRHIFAPQLSLEAAYDNRPQPIGYGQTISQPYIVGVMTSLLEPKPDDKILEIGTGSGYQAAVLAKLNVHVYSVEIIPELIAQAKLKFAQLALTNIFTENRNGIEGWPEHAPYCGIMVTAASQTVPKPLVDQLEIGGKLVIPIEDTLGQQELMLITKQSATQVSQKSILPVRFVPFQPR